MAERKTAKGARAGGAASPLARRLDLLEREAGPAPALPSEDPLALILWENVAYLVDDERRARAFAELSRRVGLAPRKILAASEDTLLDVAGLGGMRPPDRVQKLRDIATIAQERAGGDLKKALDSGTLPQARKLLKAFPGIGDPGADKILLASGREPVLALDSNALRVLLRLGYGAEDRNYAKSYRSARDAAAAELPPQREALVRAMTLLRRHGQTTCKNASPDCAACPLTAGCRWFAEHRG